MQEPAQIERLWWPRLRWRMRGAWQWPVFGVLTVADGILLDELPFYDRGPGSLVGGLLFAAFVNLLLVAVVAPLAGRRLRKARPDLPRLVATDYAGTFALGVVTLAFVAGGLLHRSSVLEENADVASAIASTHDYVVTQAPRYQRGLLAVDVMRVEKDLYRTCVPGADPRRWLCLFVNTVQQPAGVTLDPDEAPNSAYRMHGGFR